MTTPVSTSAGFDLIRPSDLDGRQSLELHPGVVAFPVRWSASANTPLPVEAYVRFAPGSGYREPDHHADSRERILVLSGELRDENGTYPAGSRIEGALGTTHTPHSLTGCLIYVTFPDRDL